MTYLSNTANASNEGMPMMVRRVTHVGGSHIEPRLEVTWSDMDKLRWLAGVMQFDSGISVRITSTLAGTYGLSGSIGRDYSWSEPALSFHATWSRLSAMAHGARLADRLAEDGRIAT